MDRAIFVAMLVILVSWSGHACPVDVPNITRHGESWTLELDPGMYRIDCIRFLPQLQVRVAGSADPDGVINARSDTSIAWDDYHGDLKFW